jgi:hypothetical protein
MLLLLYIDLLMRPRGDVLLPISLYNEGLSIYAA